jgi:hypothetical protein
MITQDLFEPFLTKRLAGVVGGVARHAEHEYISLNEVDRQFLARSRKSPRATRHLEWTGRQGLLFSSPFRQRNGYGTPELARTCVRRFKSKMA